MCLDFCLATTTPLPNSPLQNTLVHSSVSCSAACFAKPGGDSSSPWQSTFQSRLFVYKVTQPSLQSVGA